MLYIVQTIRKNALHRANQSKNALIVQTIRNECFALANHSRKCFASRKPFEMNALRDAIYSRKCFVSCKPFEKVLCSTQTIRKPF
jgi:hypothetical protein